MVSASAFYTQQKTNALNYWNIWLHYLWYYLTNAPYLLLLQIFLRWSEYQTNSRNHSSHVGNPSIVYLEAERTQIITKLVSFFDWWIYYIIYMKFRFWRNITGNHNTMLNAELHCVRGWISLSLSLSLSLSVCMCMCVIKTTFLWDIKYV